MISEKQVFEVLQEINSRVPKEWRENVVIEKDLTPTMQKVIDDALIDPTISEEKKKELQNMKDAGYFHKKQFGEDHVIARKIHMFTQREINKAVKEGRLPNKKRLAELQEIWKNQKNNL